MMNIELIFEKISRACFQEVMLHRKGKIFLFVFVCMSIIPTCNLFPERCKIILTNGQRLYGQLISEKDGKLTVLCDDQKNEIQVDKKEILEKHEIKYKLRNVYFLLGGTIGFPAYINLNFGVHIYSFGINVSGFMWPYAAAGGQLNILWKLFDEDSFCLSIAAIGGYSISAVPFVGSIRLPYIGVAPSFNWGEFYCELGINYVLFTTSGNPMLVSFQIGYIYRFNKDTDIAN